MFNLAYYFQNSSYFTPYISAGLGAAFLNWDSGYSDDYGTTPVSASGDETQFAWSVGAGCSYALSEKLDFDLAYRYLDAGESELEYLSLKAIADLKIHEFMVGIRYKF